METDTLKAKAALRQDIRGRLKSMTPAQRSAASLQARSLLAGKSVWKKAKSILVYAPLPEELDVWPLVLEAAAGGKTIALPRFDSVSKKYGACRVEDLANDLVSGQFGIREPGGHCVPVPLNRLDLVLVPGVAFNLQGRRLGRGKGFYDQLLALVRGTTCGVAFDEQIVAEIPVEPHDIHLNCILTPTRWIEP
jgi:5-formyltetrahydrofolate cyclo-ligase